VFFRRDRLSARKARALLLDLFNQGYQWPLRMPIVHLLRRGDPLRFLCSLRFLVDQIGSGMYLLNQRRPPEQMPWFGADLAAATTSFSIQPLNLSKRLTDVMRLDDPQIAAEQTRRLLLEIIELTPKEKARNQEEQPVVTWLARVANFESGAEIAALAESEPADLLRLARRAVRIVWRLPGSRLATLTGSVAAGYADLTSDIDIALFGLKLPDATVRRSLVAATSDAPNDITQLTHKTHAADVFWLQNRLVDVRYFLIEEAERLIAHPAPHSPADFELLAHLSTADVLVDYEFRGPDLLRNLQKATRQARPERVAWASIRLEQALTQLKVARDVPPIFYATVEAILALFQLLAAHNDRWIVFPKWTPVWLAGLEHVPAEAHARLSAIALLPSTPEHTPAKLHTLRALTNELK